MAYTINSRALAIAVVLILPSFTSTSIGVGLSTRDQNPMFQAYYLPTNTPQTQAGWNISHSVFVTNTFQMQSNANEALIIDAETYRYDLSIAYQRNDWRVSALIPFYSTQRGSLDSIIEDWHDFFGLPQNDRKQNPDDQLNINYTRNGKVVYLQTRSSSGLGDLGLSLSYLLASDDKGATELSFAIDLPTGSSAENTGNDKVDLSIWLRKTSAAATQSSLFGLIGVSRLGKGGQLEDHLERLVWTAQFGFDYALKASVSGVLQLDLHSSLIKNSALTALGNSAQIQIGLKFTKLIDNQDFSLFFSEDLLVGSAPDITFGLQLNRSY